LRSSCPLKRTLRNAVGRDASRRLTSFITEVQAMGASRAFRRAQTQAALGIGIAAFAASAIAAEVKLDGRTFTLPDGFTIERVAGPPMVDRPIEADFDEQGRLYVTDSSGSSAKPDVQLREKPNRVVRLEDTDGDGTFDKQTVFADQMPFPEGAMWRDGALYVAAPPSIWKLDDPAGTGVAAARSEWFQGKTLTGCANDLHGPYAGPDGWIYWCKGAFAEQTYDRPGGRKPFVTRASHLMRSRPDGTGVEPVMTGGMDNPVGVAFTPGGERIVSGTFLQHPAGGRRDGLIHAVYGGVYGKVHDVLDNHPRTSPDVMPILSHLGPAAPCGLTRYESEVFGVDYRDNLFTTCFNLRKVVRHVLTPDGSTFKSTDSDFLVCDDLDFHPTDVLEDADGGLLIVDTGAWYKICCPTSQLVKPDVLGAIYRVRRTDVKKAGDPRRLKLKWDKLDGRALSVLLGDPHPAVRRRAIAAVGAKGFVAIDPIAEVFTSQTTSARARLNAVWALARIDEQASRLAVMAGLDDADETVRIAAAHALSAWRFEFAGPSLAVMLARDTSSPAERRVAAEALGRVGRAQDVNMIFAVLAKRPDVDRVLEHSLTYAVIEINDPAAAAKGLASESPRVRRAALVALDQMDDARPDRDAVVRELTSPDAALRETAAWIAARHPEWGAQLEFAFSKRLGGAGTLTDGEQAELRRQLASLAKSAAIRDLLTAWMSDGTTPGRRVAVGAAADAGLKEVPVEWVTALTSVLHANDAALLSDGVAALRRLSLDKAQATEAAGPLLRLAARGDVPAAVRVEAVAAIPTGGHAIGGDLFKFLLSQLAPAEPATQRLAAAQAIGRVGLTRDQLLALTAAVRDAGAIEIDRLLAAFEKGGDEEVGRALVASLRESRGRKGLRADAVRARLAKFPQAVRDAAEPLLEELNPDAARQRAQLDELLATLPEGDVRRGQAVFNNQTTACVACHAIGYVGGTLGPDLTRIGQTRGRRDLLESIVYPSASFVQSYEPVIVVVEGGANQGGLVRRNDANEVVVATGPQQEVRVPRAKVKEVRPSSVSIMPQGMEEQLSKQELADLIAFLAAAK
jgi:putative membrane-bound dehydrogenase-like protein